MVLVPKSEKRRSWFRFYFVATSSAQGQFNIKNVIPGEYKAYAWDDVDPWIWMDPEFMRPINGKGEELTVEEGGHARVNLQLMPQ